MSRRVLSISAVLVFTIATVPDSIRARIAGKTGYGGNHYSGRATSGINDVIIWVSIGMAATIAILISLALCYIMREKCKKRVYYITA